MASTSKELLDWEEKQKSKETWYTTKTIEFFGRRTPIILQETNGPCPLLAVCNILSLRNKLGLSEDVAHVSEAGLLTLVADSLINSIDSDENVKAVNAAINMLPVLAKPLGVNIRFKQIDEIEATSGCAIFDILDITLCHGWLVDPQDPETSDAFGSTSYDTLMVDLADLQILNMEAASMMNFEESYPLIGLELPKTVDHGEDDKASHDRQMNTSEPEKRESNDGIEKTSSEVMKETEKSDGDYSRSRVRHDGDWITFETHEVVKNTEKLEGECSSSWIGYNDERVTFDETTSNEASSSEPIGNEGKLGISASQGKLIKKFMDSNKTQLTVHGLFCLRDGLEDGKLYMLFRNDHFTTLFKFQGTLYTLVTDIGYRHKPGVVWEKLSKVDGNNEYVNKNFKINEPEIEECTWDEETLKRKNDAYLDRVEYTEAEANTSTSTSKDLSSDLTLAKVFELIAERRESQHVPHAPFPTGFIVGPEHNYSIWPRNPPKKSSKKISKRLKEKCKLM